jgi:YidC/Oxa1 family membrane protein insertase
MMDKRTILAFVLISALFLVWMQFFSPKPEPVKPGTGQTQSPQSPHDSGASSLPGRSTPPEAATVDLPEYRGRQNTGGRFITVETPLYTAQFNTLGARLYRFELKQFKNWYGKPAQLIADSTGFGGELALAYRSRDGRMINTGDLLYDVEAPPTITLKETDSVVITARLPLGAVAVGDSTPVIVKGKDTVRGSDTNRTPGAASGAIVKRFVFRGNSYGIGLDVTMDAMASQIDGSSYQLLWQKGLKYQEYNSVDEASKGNTKVMVAGSMVKFDAGDIGVTKTDTAKGEVAWAGLNTKYFAAALIPSKPVANGEVIVTTTSIGADSGGHVESVDMRFRVPYTKPTETTSFTLYAGPLDYNIVSDFGLTDMVDLGFTWIVRPIAQYFMLPFFRAIHAVIPNWGLVIIVFSLIMRGILWPLSIPQIKSSRKMQLLQPKIAELREKNADDPQKQQMATMALYREYGINPVGGCLPLLLQMPILYALWATLGSAIELRQADFALWIHDLSVPDVIATLPFSIPLLGNKLSGLALIMGVTLFIQQKMMISDPKQKAMVYMMPLLLTLTFTHFPSGLNLYYLMFNLLSIGQQIYLTKYSKNPMTLEEMRRQAGNKKPGWLATKMAEAQKMAEMQQQGAGRSGGSSGSKDIDGRTPVEPKPTKPKTRF